MSFKVPVCQRPEYTIFLQDIDGTTWAHCDVRRWSPSVAKRLVLDGDAVFWLHGGPLFAVNEPHGDAKHQRFLRLMGFGFFKELPALDGGTRLIFIRGNHGT